MGYRVELLGISDFLLVQYTYFSSQGLLRYWPYKRITIRYAIVHTIQGLRGSSYLSIVLRLCLITHNGIEFYNMKWTGPIFSSEGTKLIFGICGCEANAKSGPCLR